MSRLGLTLSLLLLPNLAWAEVTVIYREADQVVCGWVEPPQMVSTELLNCALSELGGEPEDYATTVVKTRDWQPGKQVVVDPEGEVTFEKPPLSLRDRDFLAASGKLRTLGLTTAEIDALR